MHVSNKHLNDLKSMNESVLLLNSKLESSEAKEISRDILVGYI